MKPLTQRDGRKTLALVGGIFITLFIVGYTLFVAYPYLSGPSVTLSAKQNGALTEIYGTTARVAYLTLNGIQIPTAEDGTFSAIRAYPAGYTAVTAVAEDRFGRSITKTLTFVTEPATTTTSHGEEEN